VERVGFGRPDVELAIKNVEKCTIEVFELVWCGGIF
jgi:hypothetical protein